MSQHPNEKRKQINQRPNVDNGIVSLSIPTIHCQGCVDNINKSFLLINGIESVEGDPELKTITIRIDKYQVKIGQIKKTLQNLGHQLESIKIT